MSPLERGNAWLDAWPRVRVAPFARPAPAFRVCGVAGYYAALLVTVCLGLARGRDLAVTLALAAVCGASFFAYAHLRKWITGRETLVLLEHVWVALACSAAALVAMREPVLAHLDDVAAAMAIFLTAGRLGCFLVGCCHGLPSECGVRYPHEHGKHGFPAELVGVRLFPVQLAEAAGLLLLGATVATLALVAPEGVALTFFLFGYAVLRFGLEAIRGDRRPSFLGISQARWMTMAQAAFALVIAERAGPRLRALVVLGAVCGVALVLYVARSAVSLRARALRPRNLRALRAIAGDAEPDADPEAAPVAVSGPLGFVVATSHAGRVVSLSAPGARDVLLLCEVACGAFPELDASSALLTPGGVLVVELPSGLQRESPTPLDGAGRRLFASLARAAQTAAAPPPHAAPATPESAPPHALTAEHNAFARRSDWYFQPAAAAHRHGEEDAEENV